MQSLKHVTKSSRAYLLPLLHPITTSSLFSSSPSPLLVTLYYYCSYSSSSAAAVAVAFQDQPPTPKEVFWSMKEWFKSGNKPWLDQIFYILSKDGKKEDEDLAMSSLGLRLSESLVLEVLSYGDNKKKDVLACLKFFDWAGRQPKFFHSGATFHAIFKILKKSELMSLMIDFLSGYKNQKHVEYKGFASTLVMGYAVTRKIHVALQLFGQMRYKGLDLDYFTYHILLNALVEERDFDAAEVISNQISLRGLENDVTHSIMVKGLCRRGLWEEAVEYLKQRVEKVGGRTGHGFALSYIVDGFCQNMWFGEAGKMIEDFRRFGAVPMGPAYGVWLRSHVRGGIVDKAFNFLKNKQSTEGYVPEVFRYNILLCRLLKENRLREAYDVLSEMEENQIVPDKVTMNAALCFFCKAGMVEVANNLYKCRSEFDLTVNSMAYNYLINSLCGDGSVDEAFHVLRSFFQQGHFPGRRTFTILTDALYREGKLDKMLELVMIALKRKFMPSDSVYDKLITALCRARRVQDGYLIHRDISRPNRIARRTTYSNLIFGFHRANRGDIAASLLIEMQDRGHEADRGMYRAVIRSLSVMENPESQILKLLYVQLSRQEPNCDIYNYYIDGALRARMPQLARRIFEMMRRHGIEPNLSSDILMLQSYLTSGRVSDAISFFDSLRQRRMVGRKLHNTMVVGLCKNNKTELALNYLMKMRNDGITPSMECYEVLIKLLCSQKHYGTVIYLLNDMEKARHHITSFIGNTLLTHSLKGDELYKVWLQSSDTQNETSSELETLRQLIGAFSGCLKLNKDIDNLEDVIKQCFRPDLYTYNVLLRLLLQRVGESEVDRAFECFNRIRWKGYEPNRWTYETLVFGLFKHGRAAEAERWLEEMLRRGYNLSTRSNRFVTGKRPLRTRIS